MRVYVQSKSGTWLMPTHAAKARFLLKQGKAKVIQSVPFAIQLQYDSPEIVQSVTVGIDDGGIHVGVAAVVGEKVLYQEEVNQRVQHDIVLYPRCVKRTLNLKIKGPEIF